MKNRRKRKREGKKNQRKKGRACRLEERVGCHLLNSRIGTETWRERRRRAKWRETALMDFWAAACYMRCKERCDSKSLCFTSKEYLARQIFTLLLTFQGPDIFLRSSLNPWSWGTAVGSFFQLPMEYDHHPSCVSHPSKPVLYLWKREKNIHSQIQITNE